MKQWSNHIRRGHIKKNKRWSHYDVRMIDELIFARKKKNVYRTLVESSPHCDRDVRVISSHRFHFFFAIDADHLIICMHEWRVANGVRRVHWFLHRPTEKTQRVVNCALVNIQVQCYYGCVWYYCILFVMVVLELSTYALTLQPLRMVKLA